MAKTYKITNVSELDNVEESVRVLAIESKEFNRAIVKASISTIAEVASGWGVIPAALNVGGDYTSIAVAFGVLLIGTSVLIQYNSVKKLQNLYFKRNNELLEEMGLGGLLDAKDVNNFLEEKGLIESIEEPDIGGKTR